MSADKLRLEIQQKKISLAEGILKALSLLRDKEPDETLSWLINELQGYSNALDFYHKAKHNLPAYRVVNGSLKLMGKDGNLLNLDHPLANRNNYFLGVPVSWLEEFVAFPGEMSVTDMPELGHETDSGQVVLQVSKAQLQRIIDHVRKKLIEILNKP